jgi:hypothetical protein
MTLLSLFLNLVHMLGVTIIRGIASGRVNQVVGPLTFESSSKDLHLAVRAHTRSVNVCSWLFIPVAYQHRNRGISR